MIRPFLEGPDIVLSTHLPSPRQSLQAHLDNTYLVNGQGEKQKLRRKGE